MTKAKGLAIHIGSNGIQVRDPLNGEWYSLSHQQDAAMLLSNAIQPKTYSHKPQPKPQTRVLRLKDDHSCVGQGCVTCLERKELARLQQERRRLQGRE